MVKVFYNNLNPNKLLDDFVKSGINIVYLGNDLKPNEFIAQNIEVWFQDDVNMDLVAKVVSNHNPEPLPQPMSPEERLKALEIALGVKNSVE